MKKLFVLFTVVAVTFLMSGDLYSSNKGINNSTKEIIVYCAVNRMTGTCCKNIVGVACYLVDENCDWMDEEDQPEA